MEEWRDVVGYEGLYQVSNYGNVKSLGRIMLSGRWGRQKSSDKILKGLPNKGYIRVVLCKNANIKRFLVHRLVAQAFMGISIEFSGNNLVCHKNDIRSDNRVENLFAGTYSDNNNDCVNKGRGVNNANEKHGMCKLSDKDIINIREQLNIGISQKDISEKYGVHRSHINRINSNLSRKL